MVPKVFILGATGYIGGDALYEIVSAHPEWDVTCSVRNSDKGASVVQKYPSIRLVYGDLNSTDMIVEEASKADIVYHFADCDHEGSARAIVQGLAQRESSEPAFYIHTSGAMILAYETKDKGIYGSTLPRVFDDWEEVSHLTRIPDHAAHRNVDKIVLAAAQQHPGKIKTAIVCPPVIYGAGRGPGNQRSVQLYRAAEAFMKHKRAFKIGKGENVWHEVHVQDLSRLYLLLGEAATNGGSPATWDDQGYYLAENGSVVWGEVLELLAKEVTKQGRIERLQMEELSPSEADDLMPYAKSLLGTDSRGVSKRAKNLLGWQPKEQSMTKEIPAVVESEALRLGLVKTHAAQVKA